MLKIVNSAVNVCSNQIGSVEVVFLLVSFWARAKGLFWLLSFCFASSSLFAFDFRQLFLKKGSLSKIGLFSCYRLSLFSLKSFLWLLVETISLLLAIYGFGMLQKNFESKVWRRYYWTFAKEAVGRERKCGKSLRRLNRRKVELKRNIFI